MRICLVTFVLILLSSCSNSESGLKVDKRSAFTIGDSIQIHSEVLNEDRVLNVYLPASYYSDSEKTYPVIYLLDGSKDEDFIHIVGLVQFLSFSWINTMPEAIVVGIANVDRQRDFTFPSMNQQDNNELPSSGASAEFINFIEKELQPFIDLEYKTNSSKTLIGQSLGGLLATEILLNQPALFNNYIIISPSLWWNDESLLSHPSTLNDFGGKIFIGVGQEGEVMERVAQTLFENITNSISEPGKVSFKNYPQLNHGDTLHLAAYNALEEVFSQ